MLNFPQLLSASKTFRFVPKTPKIVITKNQQINKSFFSCHGKALSVFKVAQHLNDP